MFKKLLISFCLLLLSSTAFASASPQVRIVTNKGSIELELNRNVKDAQSDPRPRKQ